MKLGSKIKAKRRLFTLSFCKKNREELAKYLSAVFNWNLGLNFLYAFGRDALDELGD